jgi:hypothetical protein
MNLCFLYFLTALKDRKMTSPVKSRFSPRYRIKSGNQRFAADRTPFFAAQAEQTNERVSNAV